MNDIELLIISYAKEDVSAENIQKALLYDINQHVPLNYIKNVIDNNQILIGK